MKALLVFVILAVAARVLAADLPFYIGTYTGGKADSKGIYHCYIDDVTGLLGPVTLAAQTPSPSFLAMRPDGNFLYAVNEAGEGTVSAFSRDVKSGNLKHLNTKPAGGTAPCHIVVDKTGANVLFANYGGGSVGVYRVAEDGSLGKRSGFVQHKGSSVNPHRQKGPHGHAINLDAGNRFAMASDLGLDKVLIYAFDPTKGTLTPGPQPFAKVHPGSGPRHFAFHPDGKFAFVLNEMVSTITGFAYDASTGSLKALGTVSTVPDDFKGANSTAEIFVRPDGKFLYASNRGHDSIAVFAIDQSTGKLSLVEHEKTGGKTPRNFAIAPGAKFLIAANQKSDNIVVFTIDEKSGVLGSTGNSVAVPSPVCIEFVP